MKELQVTQREYDAQQAKIKSLHSELDLAIRRREDARKEGDLRENSEYESAENEANRLSTAIRDAQEILDAMIVVDTEDSDTKQIILGSDVRIRNLDTNKVYNFKLVSTEGKPGSTVSINSLLAQNILNKTIGDTAEYTDILYRKQRFIIEDVS